MNNVSIEKVLTSNGVEFQIVRDDGVILATTCIDYYADVILKAIAADIDKNDNEDF